MEKIKSYLLCTIAFLLMGFSALALGQYVVEIPISETSSDSVSDGGVDDSGTPPADSGCYDPANQGTIGEWPGCDGMYIAGTGESWEDNEIQKAADGSYSITHEGTSYTFSDSQNNIFTGQIKDFDFVFSRDTTFNGDIGYWDTSNVTSMERMFRDSTFNRDISSWDVSSVTNMDQIFADSAFNKSIADWDTSSLKSLDRAFEFASYSQSLSGWDVSKITNMDKLFERSDFNGDISSWDVSSVTSMEEMFLDTPFNKAVKDWDVSNVEDMSYMFSGSSFDKPVESWDVSNAKDMSGMFQDTPFNQEIGSWDVSNVTSMRSMFYRTPFNKPVGGWDVSSVTDMEQMFYTSYRSDYEANFNQPIGNWDVSNVTNMKGLLHDQPFNQSLSGWDVSSVKNMEDMLSGTEFNGDISGWDVSSVTNMNGVFVATPFNRDISSWNVSNVRTMKSTFKMSSFNKDISAWDVNNVDNMVNMFGNSEMSQPLSEWCLPFIESKPSSFDLSSPLADLPDSDMPSWGECSYNYKQCSSDSLSTGELCKDESGNELLVVDNSMLKSIVNRTEEEAREGTSDPQDTLTGKGKFHLERTKGDGGVYTGKVTDMSGLFQSSSLNPDIGYWNTSNVTSMKWMFQYADNFNQDISSWNVPKIDQKPDRFDSGAAFENQPSIQPLWVDPPEKVATDCSEAAIGKVCTDSEGYQLLVVNQSDLESVIDDRIAIGGEVYDTERTTGDGGVYTGNITDMSSLFSFEDVNPDIGYWDTSNVTNMDNMFVYASNFNQDISSWDVPKIDQKPESFDSQAAFEGQTSLQPSWGSSSQEGNLGRYTATGISNFNWEAASQSSDGTSFIKSGDRPNGNIQVDASQNDYTFVVDTSFTKSSIESNKSQFELTITSDQSSEGQSEIAIGAFNNNGDFVLGGFGETAISLEGVTDTMSGSIDLSRLPEGDLYLVFGGDQSGNGVDATVTDIEMVITGM